MIGHSAHQISIFNTILMDHKFEKHYKSVTVAKASLHIFIILGYSVTLLVTSNFHNLKTQTAGNLRAAFNLQAAI